MHKSHAWVIVLLLLVWPMCLSAEERRPQVGDTIDDLQFKDIRGLNRSLAELGKKRAYVFVFTTTHCPLVNRTLPKLIELDAKFAPQDVQFVAVNVGVEDTLRLMAAQAIEFEAAFPFVKDADLTCARRLGVQRTPEVAVLNADKKLVYRGRVDDQLRLGGARPEPTRLDLEIALEELLAGKEILVTSTQVDGCLITSPPSVNTTAPAPTFYKDIAPILHERCVKCHRPNAGAPFSLLTLEDASAQAEMIAEVVTDERMPPWYANPQHGKFANDPSLTREQRETIVKWVRTGRTPGNPEEAPPVPKLPTTKWRIGEPDLVISMLEQHDIPATGYLPYKYVLLPHIFLRETWLEAIEILPDNPQVVHHANLAYVTPQGAGVETFFTGHVPGGQPMDLGKAKNAVAYRVPPFAGLGLQIHYTTTGKPEKCRISIGLRFPRRVIEKKLHHFLLDPRRFKIPPGHGAFALKASQLIEHDITLLGLFTHMHLRGKDMTFYAESPGQPRRTLLQIPNYNFEWQLGYEIEAGDVRLPKGTIIEAIAHFDNSAFNPYNPDATRTVPNGQQSYDEMFNGYGFYTVDTEELKMKIDPKTGGRAAEK